jgi:seryl-tRNA synthetase
MHDIKFIRQNPEAFDAALARRKLAPLSSKIIELDKQNRGGITELQALQEKSNRLAKQIGELMAQGKKAEAGALIAESKEAKDELAILKKSLEEGEAGGASSAVNEILSTIPNILEESVPNGADESANVELRKFGEVKKLSFTPKQHFEIGEDLGLLDFEQTAKFAGSRMASLKGNLAKLERALAGFMLDTAAEFGYTEYSVPYLVRPQALYGTSQLPKFEEDLFKTTDSRYLIPTAEVPLTNMVREKILEEGELPLRLTGFTPCFRSEAGSAGRDTRGLIRMHQFGKVELVSITKPEDSKAEHERLTNCAEEVLKRLNIPYRLIVLCSGDTGFGSQKTYDIEAWLPGQNAYREISSCSNFGEFQARRMDSRFRRKDSGKVEFVHTLNGSALATGRTIVAILENYQNADGSVSIPEKLVKYFGCEKL